MHRAGRRADEPNRVVACGWTWCGRELPQPPSAAMPEESTPGVRIPGERGHDQDAQGKPGEHRNPSSDQRALQSRRQQLCAE